ncbi:MAG: DUF192 domain-containing protein [Candidatus Omnitrophota bacterium]|nr:MAG: DUF192 domain-containing protein [Candidatus Omnitrophota bacterium]
MKGTTLAEQARFAESFLQRLLGLMGKKNMEKGNALIFKKAPSIHTFFMKFAIDIVFVDASMRILKTYQALGPFRFAGCLRSVLTVELPANTLSQTRTAIGDTLELKPTI